MSYAMFQLSTVQCEPSFSFELFSFCDHFLYLQALFAFVKTVTASLIARLLFIAHSTACIFIAVSTTDLQFLYLLFLPISLLVLEAFLTLKLRDNAEWKWLVIIFLLLIFQRILFQELFRTSPLSINISSLLGLILLSAII